MGCVDADRTSDVSSDESMDYGLDAFPLDSAYCQTSVVEEAFVDVAEREVKLPVASDVVVAMHPMTLAVGHTFCLMGLLSVMLTTQAVVSYVVIVDALKLDDHVRLRPQQLPTMLMLKNDAVNATDFLSSNCSVAVTENLCDEQMTVVTKHTEHLDSYD